MKKMTITGIMADFLDSIRAYEHESGEAIHSDERESSEFVDMYFNGGGKINIEENKPLFVTEEGVECFDKDEYYSIGVGFKAVRMRALEHDRPYSSDAKRFKHEANADEYIWRNKRVFSYKDIQNYGVHPVNMIRVEQLAKERIKG